MFLAIREIAFARGRFILMGSVVALIAVLMVLLSGLSVGLVNDGVSGLQRLKATSFAFQEGIGKDSAFSRSLINLNAVDEWSDQAGVEEAAPFGNTLVNGKTSQGIDIDLALFGIDTESYLNPQVAEGAGLTGSPNEIVISATAAEEGIAVGDTVAVEQTGGDLKVVGILGDQHTFGHVDIAYLPLSSWQEIRAGIREGDAIPDRIYGEITAVAVRGQGVDLAAGDKAAGTSSLTTEESYGASPGYTAETSTLMLIQVFLYAISALVVGAFFTVLTIQRRKEIAVMRAMGASTRYLLRDSLTQSVILLVVSAAVGIAVGLGLGSLITSTAMPFALEGGPIAVAAGSLVGLGLVGAALAVVRIVRMDPLAALGENR